MINKHSQETVDKVKNYYINNDVSFTELSKLSVELFGINLSSDDLKTMSRFDVNGSWGILKANKGRKTEDIPMQEKLNLVANKLYEMIVDPESEIGPSQIAQYAKTWSDLVDKAKLSKDSGASAKTSAQAVKDIFEKISVS